jgi:hypothetical protein
MIIRGGLARAAGSAGGGDAGRGGAGPWPPSRRDEHVRPPLRSVQPPDRARCLLYVCTIGPLGAGVAGARHGGGSSSRRSVTADKSPSGNQGCDVTPPHASFDPGPTRRPRSCPLEVATTARDGDRYHPARSQISPYWGACSAAPFATPRGGPPTGQRLGTGADAPNGRSPSTSAAQRAQRASPACVRQGRASGTRSASCSRRPLGRRAPTRASITTGASPRPRRPAAFQHVDPRARSDEDEVGCVAPSAVRQRVAPRWTPRCRRSLQDGESGRLSTTPSGPRPTGRCDIRQRWPSLGVAGTLRRAGPRARRGDLLDRRVGRPTSPAHRSFGPA